MAFSLQLSRVMRMSLELSEGTVQVAMYYEMIRQRTLFDKWFRAVKRHDPRRHSRLFQWVGEFRDTVKHYAALLRETMDATAHAGGGDDFEGEITMKMVENSVKRGLATSPFARRRRSVMEDLYSPFSEHPKESRMIRSVVRILASDVQHGAVVLPLSADMGACR